MYVVSGLVGASLALVCLILFAVRQSGEDGDGSQTVASTDDDPSTSNAAVDPEVDPESDPGSAATADSSVASDSGEALTTTDLTRLTR